jgi:hypothetical protein
MIQMTCRLFQFLLQTSCLDHGTLIAEALPSPFKGCAYRTTVRLGAVMFLDCFRGRSLYFLASLSPASTWRSTSQQFVAPWTPRSFTSEARPTACVLGHVDSPLSFMRNNTACFFTPQAFNFLRSFCRDRTRGTYVTTRHKKRTLG